jgi:hypothetical protein
MNNNTGIAIPTRKFGVSHEQAIEDPDKNIILPFDDQGPEYEVIGGYMIVKQTLKNSREIFRNCSVH